MKAAVRGLCLIGVLACGLASVRVDAATLTELRRIALPGVQGRIDHMAFEPEKGRVYIAALGNHTVEVIDLASARVLKALTGFEEAQGILVLGHHTALIADGGRGDVAVVDTQNLEVRTRIPLREDPDNIRADRAAARVYVGAGKGGGGALEILDAATLENVGVIALPAHPESFQLASTAPRIYVNVPDAGGVVAVLDRVTRKQVALWHLPAQSNFPMALDNAHQRVFIGARRPARLLVLAGDTGAVVANVPMVGDADDLFFDEEQARIYVSGGEGYVQAFHQDDPDHYTSIQKVPTRRGARTSLFLPAQRCLLVAVPREGGAEAELRVFSTAAVPQDEQRPCT